MDKRFTIEVNDPNPVIKRIEEELLELRYRVSNILQHLTDLTLQNEELQDRLEELEGETT